MSWRRAGRGRAPPRQARDEQVQADAALAAMIAEEERRLVRQQRQEQGYTGRAASGSGRKRGLPLASSKSAAAAPAAAAGSASVPKRPKRIKRRKKVTEGSARSLGSSSTSAASSSSSSASSSLAAAVASWTPSADAAASESARRAAELRLLEKLNKLDMNVSVVPGDGSKLLDAFRGQVVGADQSIAHLTHFRDGRAYVRFWEYLVLENLRAQLRSEYEASLGDEEGVVSGTVGELSQAGKAPWASVKASNEDAFRLTLRKRAGTRLGMPCAANDVILIVPEQCKANEGAGASFPVEYLLALAERGVSASATQLRVRLTFAEAARQAKSARRPELGHTHHVARCFVRLLNASPVLRARLSGKSVQEMPSVAKRTTFRLVNLRSAVPVLREYVALRTLEESSPLAQMLIQPPWTGVQQQADESSHEKGWKHVPPGFREHLRASLNARQLDAVGSTLDCLADAASASRIALLQGPPGTGKTRTVVALLNALHLNMYQKFYRKLVDGAAEIIKRMRGEAGSGKAEAAAAAAAAVHAPGGLASILAHQEAQRSRTAASASVATQQRQLLARAAQEKPRILVCAPSNGAVDEIISRVRFVDGELVEYEPTMLRIGRESRVQEGAQQAVLSVQVAEWMRLGSARSRAALAERTEIAQAKIDEAHVRLNQFVGTGLRSVEERMALASLAEELANANLELSRCQMVQALGQAGTSRVQDRVRAQLEKSLLDNAHIVFATLSGTGGALMRDNPRPFDLVIVDEAAQSAETTTLIGLCRRTTRCVLVGDPAQLPATVHIRDGTLACRLAERSLFERLQAAGCPVVDLRVQYRMHPAIRAFPSRRFYGDRLQDGDNVLSREYARAFHAHAPFLPYAFFQVNGRERLAHGRSAANDAEVHAVLDHLAAFLHAFPDVDPARIGIITGYRGQQARFRSLVRRHPMRARLQAVEVNTVDAFQGREKDIVVISCVRSSHGASRTSTIGFLASVKRMNVMLTRAKYALWVFGDARALSTNRDWRALLDDARHRRVYLEPRGV